MIMIFFSLFFSFKLVCREGIVEIILFAFEPVSMVCYLNPGRCVRDIEYRLCVCVVCVKRWGVVTL